MVVFFLAENFVNKPPFGLFLLAYFCRVQPNRSPPAVSICLLGEIMHLTDFSASGGSPVVPHTRILKRLPWNKGTGMPPMNVGSVTPTHPDVLIENDLHSHFVGTELTNHLTAPPSLQDWEFPSRGDRLPKIPRNCRRKGVLSGGVTGVRTGSEQVQRGRGGNDGGAGILK